MALVRFHSKAGGDFFFMPDTQKQVFKVLGRPCTASGAISPEEAKEWIAILESAISREKADDKKREEDRKGARAYPLLQLLKAAVEENEMVMWGVP